MTFDLFQSIAKTITLSAKPKPIFNTRDIEKMTAIDCMSIISHNAVSFQDKTDEMIIDGKIIPKDGYSDGARLQLLVKQAVSEEFRNALLPPGLKGQKWGELPFAQAYLFKQDFDAAYSKKLAKAKVCNAESVKIWGGIYQKSADDVELIPQKVDGKYVKQGDFETIQTPATEPYYHNFTIRPRDVASFLSCQTNFDDWAERECDEDDVCDATGRHVHLVSARYLDTWTTIDEEGRKVEVALAPPIGLVLPNLAFRVTKNCILDKTREAQTEFRQALITAGAQDKPSRKPTSPQKEGEEDEEAGAFHGKIYMTAMQAAKDLAVCGDYEDLSTVIRNAGNVHWRKLDKIAPTSSSQIKIKKDLGAIFSTHILPMVQKTGGCTMKQVLAKCHDYAQKYGSRKDTVFGYFMSRLAEPINDIKTIDGKLQIVQMTQRVCGGDENAAEEEEDSKFWFDN
jgi:hypothetical protein